MRTMTLRRRAVALAAAALLLSGCGPAPGPTVYIREAAPAVSEYDRQTGGAAYVLTPSSGKFHRPSCAWAEKIDAERRIDWTGDREELLAVGYQPCHYCEP